MSNNLHKEKPVVLITGGAGFIGSHLAEYYLAEGSEVRVLDNLRSGKRENLAGLDITWIEGSILDRENVRRAVAGVDYVFHLAAMVSVAESMDDVQGCVEVNVKGLLTVLEEAAAAGASKLCLSSSAAIYGDNPTVPKVETMTPEPKSPYAITKLDGEYYCHLFRQEGRLNTVCLRYFNVYGPRQNPESQYAAAVPIFIDRALKGEPLTIFGDGGQTRDFVYVKDIVAANAFAAARPDLAGVFNVGRGKRLTVKALAETILAETQSKSEILYQDERPGDVRHSQADVSKMRQVGFSAKTPLPDGLAATIAAIREMG